MIRPRLPNFFALVVATTLVACLASSALAEVAVSTQREGLLYVINPIVDDPDPFVWGRVSSPGSARALLNEQGDANGDGSPSILVTRDTRIPVVVWARNSPGGFEIVASKYLAGNWTVPLPVAAAPGPYDELDPFLLQDPTDGTVHLLYWSGGNEPVVLHRHAASDLSSWSAAEQISQSGQRAVRPSGVIHEGNLLVVYEAHPFGLETTPREIILATEQATGFTFETLATTTNAAENRPQVHARANRVWVEWIDTDDEMRWTRQETPGSWQAPRFEGFENAEERDYHVRGEIECLANQP